jgi:hypothetical protein
MQKHQCSSKKERAEHGEPDHGVERVALELESINGLRVELPA